MKKKRLEKFLSDSAGFVSPLAAALIFAACGTSKLSYDASSWDGKDLVDWADGIDFFPADGDVPTEGDLYLPDTVEVICTPGESECIDESTRRFCNESGTAYETQSCSTGFVCLEGECEITVCVPGRNYCIDASTWQVCNSTGTGYTPGGSCAEGETCNEGECLEPCEIAEVMKSSIGCIYYAVDTNPMHSWIPGDYAVALSNTHEARAANVVIEVKGGGVWTLVGSYNISPRALQAVVLPHRYIDGSALFVGGAYRITSDLPIIAYQFNPLDGSSSYLSDASLLLPRSGLDTYHLVSAWPQGPADDRTPEGYPAHIQIAATAPTSLTVTSSIATTAGIGVPALSPGVPATFSLDEGDYLQLTVANLMNSFTGTYIESDQPVAVFSSNDCVNVPADLAYCCCEHLEEQLFGLQRWGRTYVGSRVPQRGGEPAVWQILASEDSTTLTFDYNPSVTGLPASVVLNRGDRVEYQVNGSPGQPGDFYVSADKPIHVSQFMVGAFMVTSGGSNGDPSMVQAVPVDQFLDRYVVLVPTTWENDYFVLTRRAGASVLVDGVPVSASWVQAGSSGFEVARVLVPDGVHLVEGDMPFGIIVVGYDSYDSYAYPGGLNPQVINPV